MEKAKKTKEEKIKEIEAKKAELNKKLIKLKKSDEVSIKNIEKYALKYIIWLLQFNKEKMIKNENNAYKYHYDNLIKIAKDKDKEKVKKYIENILK